MDDPETQAARPATVPFQDEVGSVANATADRAGYVVEDQVGFLLRRAHQRHAALFQQGIGVAELTPTQFTALIKMA